MIKRIEQEISAYTTGKIELSEGVNFSQHQTIKRIMKFKNRDLAGTKIDDDLRYIYYFDIISPRADSEVKNLRMDTKHILPFSYSPRVDFEAVFVIQATLKEWMRESGEAERLNSSVEEFVGMGNIGFKKVGDGYETVDPLNTFVTNQTAETIDDTDLIEKHDMTASQLMAMDEWDKNKVKSVIKELGNKTFSSTISGNTTQIMGSQKRYEIFEFSGEVSEKEFNELKDKRGGDENKYFLAKMVVAGLRKGGKGQRYVLFAEKLDGKLSDHYLFAHRGRYEGRFWRVGMYELLFDHQVRANEIGNQIARGLEWASKVIFKSPNQKTTLQNVRADLDNGDIIEGELQQVDVRLRGLDQLIADWNRVLSDADVLSNSLEVVRGEKLPAGTPFRLGSLLDTNAGKLYITLRQKLSIPYKKVFREWILKQLIKDTKGKDIIRLTGDDEFIKRFQEMVARNWYIRNLAKIGPHSQEIKEVLIEAKIRELQESDAMIENSKEIWKGVMSRMDVTITGENMDLDEQMETISNLLQLEQDPIRRAWLLDRVYQSKGLPVPPMTPQPVQQPQQSEAPQEEGFQLNQEI